MLPITDLQTLRNLSNLQLKLTYLLEIIITSMVLYAVSLPMRHVIYLYDLRKEFWSRMYRRCN